MHVVAARLGPPVSCTCCSDIKSLELLYQGRGGHSGRILRLEREGAQPFSIVRGCHRVESWELGLLSPNKVRFCEFSLLFLTTMRFCVFALLVLQFCGLGLLSQQDAVLRVGSTVSEHEDVFL